MIEEGFYKYEVQIQNIRFVTYMSEDEVELSARLAIDILEELKNINNSGFDRERLNETQKNAEAEKNELLSNILIWNKLCSERLLQIIDEIDVLRRVGGAYAMLISNPGLKSAIHAVYDRIVDGFENENLYAHSAYFLLRAIMRMHSDEV